MDRIALKELKKHSIYLDDKDILSIVKQIFQNESENPKIKSTYIKKSSNDNPVESCIFNLTSNKLFDKNILSINSEMADKKLVIRIISTKKNTPNRINKTTLFYYIKSESLVVPLLITYKNFEGDLHNEVHAAYREFIYENGKTFVLEKFYKNNEPFNFNHIEEVKYDLPSYAIQEIKFTSSKKENAIELADILNSSGVSYADFRVHDYSVSKNLQSLIELKTEEKIPDVEYTKKQKYSNGILSKIKSIFK